MTRTLVDELDWAPTRPFREPRRSIRVLLAGIATSASVLTVSVAGRADALIKHPGQHADYAVELEPHFLVGPFDPPYDPTGTGLGAGLRLTIPIVQNGFIDTINNSVGIGFGLDWVHYEGDGATIGACGAWAPGPGGTLICTSIAGPVGGPSNYFYVPVVMQWDFWLHKRFSVFGEPGLALYHESAKFQASSHLGAIPVLAAGGRWHITDAAALTFRIGYPAFSIGISFLF